MKRDPIFGDVGGIPMASMMVRRSVLDDVGGFDTSYSYAEDRDLLVRLRESGADIVVLPDIVLYRRLHDSNMILSPPDIIPCSGRSGRSSPESAPHRHDKLDIQRPKPTRQRDYRGVQRRFVRSRGDRERPCSDVPPARGHRRRRRLDRRDGRHHPKLRTCGRVHAAIECGKRCCALRLGRAMTGSCQPGLHQVSASKFCCHSG